MAEYKITVEFNEKESDGYQSPFSAIEPSQPTGGGGGGGGNNFVADLKAFSKAIPGASLVKQTFEWQISLVGRYTGSQSAQDKANASMSIAMQVGGIIAGFAAGGILGGALAIGAVGLSYIKQIDQSNYERKWENIGLTLARERAGPSFNRSREV